MGRRVVVRHRLPDGRATDVLGRLLAWDDPSGFARVAAVGGDVAIPLADILMGHPVPPAPEPRTRRGRPPGEPPPAAPSIAALHDLMADGWQPLERADYGGWRLRAAEGFTGRANSVLPLGAPPGPLPAAVDHVEAWYAARGLPGRFCVMWELGAGPEEPAYGSGPWGPLEAELTGRGYRLDYPSLVLTRPLAPDSPTAGLLPDGGPAAPIAPKPPAAEGHAWRVEVAEAPDEGFLALYRYRGEDLPPVAARVMMSAPAQAFVSVRAPGSDRTVAIGRVASSRGWSGVTAVEVAEDHRRQGLAQVVMAALLAWARERGDHSAYLQVARTNVPARALYDRLGFTAHSGYHYRIQAG